MIDQHIPSADCLSRDAAQPALIGGDRSPPDWLVTKAAQQDGARDGLNGSNTLTQPG